MKQYDEDRYWSLYLASVANPFAEQLNFSEFLKKAKNPKSTKVDRTETAEIGLNKKQIEVQIMNAEKILNGFVPPVKGCG